ncbi:MAG: hypothetical protein DCF32_23025, partial [Leptolyngbya sp.]
MVREGYKQTEIGAVPQEWEVQPLRTALRTAPKYGINAAAVPYEGILPAYIRITDISDDGHFSPNKLVGVDHRDSSQYFLEEGDLVFARTGASVGKSYLYKPQDGKLVYAGFLIRLQPDPNILLPDFLSQYVQTAAYWNWVQVMSMRSGQPGINGNEYGQLLVPIPSAEEQRAIAATLSDVDALIAALDKLIAKQRHLKTATMQQLLTGKKRLPGFGEGKGYKQTEVGVIPEDWDVKHLSQLISNLEAGVSVNSTDEENNEYENEPSVLKTSSVFNGKFSPNECKRIAARDIRRAKLNPQKEAIIISRMNTPALVGECGYVGENYNDLFLPDRLWITRFSKENYVSAKWLSCILSYGHFKKAIKDTATGTSGSMKNIAKSAFLQISVPYPGGEEQRAIATVLSDMDAAISARLCCMNSSSVRGSVAGTE